MPGRRQSPVLFSLSALVAVNLVPLAGALLLGWKASDILLVFWLENVVIGVFAVLRMAARGLYAREWEALVLIPFFIVHYGAFCAGHGFLLFAIFAALPGGIAPPELSPAFSAGPSGVVGLVAALTAQPAMAWAVVGLAVSHGVSFALNFLLGGEIGATPVRTLMGQPYARIMILHVTIILGAILVLQLGQPVWALALLVLLKIGVDAAAHLSERRAAQARAAAASSPRPAAS